MLLKQQAGIICYTFAHNKGDNRLVTGGEFSAWFVPISALTSQAKRYGVRRQAVFRATPLFKHECGGRATRKSGAARHTSSLRFVVQNTSSKHFVAGAID